MKTILAPTDFSAVSLNAVNYAADMACVLRTNLTLIHICSLPLAISEVPLPADTIDQMVADAEDKINKLKENLLFRTGERIHIQTEVKQGEFVSEISDYCATKNLYAIVMGAATGNAFERFLNGTKTISAIQQFLWPLIVVPPDAKFTGIRKIGLACDFRHVVDTIPAKELKSLVVEFNAELHVLHVRGENEDAFPPQTVEESGWLQEILVGLNPKYDFIKGNDIEKGINEFAEKNNLDLLIIIPKKHNLITKIFKHSHSKRLVLHSHVPVMAIHE